MTREGRTEELSVDGANIIRIKKHITLWNEHKVYSWRYIADENSQHVTSMFLLSEQLPSELVRQDDAQMKEEEQAFHCRSVLPWGSPLVTEKRSDIGEGNRKIDKWVYIQVTRSCIGCCLTLNGKKNLTIKKGKALCSRQVHLRHVAIVVHSIVPQLSAHCRGSVVSEPISTRFPPFPIVVHLQKTLGGKYPANKPHISWIVLGSEIA